MEQSLLTEGNEWNFSKERVYLHGMISGRFNFFMGVYSIMVGAAANVDHPWMLKILLGIGTVISVAMTLTLVHAQMKLAVVLAELRKNPQHPLTITDAQCPGRGVGMLVGYWIPAFCCVTLILGFILAMVGVLPAR